MSFVRDTVIPNQAPVQCVVFWDSSFDVLPVLGWVVTVTRDHDPDENRRHGEPVWDAEPVLPTGEELDDNSIWCLTWAIGDQRFWSFPYDRTFEDEERAMNYGMTQATERLHARTGKPVVQ